MPEKPLLIFDGDCGFCKRWIQRWKLFTEDKVEYEPYQKVAGLYPEISEENFKQSVQLVEPFETGRRITSGAEAVFRTLAYDSRRRWLLQAYEKFSAVRSLSESFYQFIAVHRPFFSKLTWIFWGNNLAPPTYRVSTFLFLRMLAVIFGFAFLSLHTQILGLLGSHGISPASLYLDQVREQLGARSPWLMPTLAWIHSGDGFLLFLCSGGVVLSAFFFCRHPSAACFISALVFLSVAGQYRSGLSFFPMGLSFAGDGISLDFSGAVHFVGPFLAHL